MAQRHALQVERTAEKAFMLSDRVELSSAEVRVEGIVGGSVGKAYQLVSMLPATHRTQVLEVL